MNNRIKPIVCVVATLFALPNAALADNKEVDELRARVVQLSDSYEKQERTIRLLEARLAEMEMSQRGRGLPQGAVMAQAGQPAGPAASGGTAEGTTTGVVKEAPRSRTTETIVQEQHALFDRKFTLETGLTYTRYDRKQLVLSGFLALDAIFLGNINLQETKSNLWTFDITGRYGLSDRFSTDFNVPLIYRNNTYFAAGAGGGASTRLREYEATKGPALGDISVGGYYQFFKESGSWPDIVGSLRIKAPTGDHPYGIKVINPDPTNNNFAVPGKLPTGNGIWTTSFGLSFLKTTDPAVLFANVGYNYNMARGFNDISSTAGVRTPGDIKLGDSFQWGAGLALALNERTSLSMSFSQLVSRASKTKAQGMGWQKVVGSQANAAVFNVGLTHAMSDRLSIIGNVGVGLTPDAPDFSVGVKLPYTF